MGFWSINVDSMGWSIALGLLFMFLFGSAASARHCRRTGALQNGVEMIVESIDDIVGSIFVHKNALIAPMALTIFVWVFMMNLPWTCCRWIGLRQGAGAIGIPHMKVVPDDRSEHHARYGAGGLRADSLLQHQEQRRRWISRGAGVSPVP